tara:strand:- start:686 stop:823 length:138 start_codon:yes stop_codon:yes gene_type:complete
MRQSSLAVQIDDLNEQIEEALAAGRQGEAEELYMELEELCREEDL